MKWQRRTKKVVSYILVIAMVIISVWNGNLINMQAAEAAAGQVSVVISEGETYSGSGYVDNKVSVNKDSLFTEETPTELKDLTKDNYEFKGWMKKSGDSEGSFVEIKSSDVELLEDDTEIYAKWETQVSVDSNLVDKFNVSDKITVTVVGTTCSIDARLKKPEIYEILGWYTDNEKDTEFKANTSIESEQTLYPKLKLQVQETDYKVEGAVLADDKTYYYKDLTKVSVKKAGNLADTDETISIKKASGEEVTLEKGENKLVFAEKNVEDSDEIIINLAEDTTAPTINTETGDGNIPEGFEASVKDDGTTIEIKSSKDTKAELKFNLKISDDHAGLSKESTVTGGFKTKTRALTTDGTGELNTEAGTLNITIPEYEGSEEETYQYEYEVKLIDGIGNEKEYTINIEVPRDGKGPDITVSPESSNYGNQDVTLTVNASDESGVSDISYTLKTTKEGEDETTDTKSLDTTGGSIPLTCEDNTGVVYEVEITAKDTLGNKSTKTVTVKIEKEKPTITTSVDGTKDTWHKDGEITITAEDKISGFKSDVKADVKVSGLKSGSGDETLEVSEGTVTDKKYTGKVTVTETEETGADLTIKISDLAGNEGTGNVSKFKVDTTKPINEDITLYSDEKCETAVSGTTLNGTKYFQIKAEDALSGVKEFRYIIDQSATAPDFTEASASLSTLIYEAAKGYSVLTLDTTEKDDGTYYLHVWAVDNAENESKTAKTVQFVIDNTAPEFTVKVIDGTEQEVTDPEVWVNQAELKMELTKDASEPVTYYVATEDKFESAEEAENGKYSVPKTVTKTYTFYVWAVDAVGNHTADAITKTVKIDADLPTYDNFTVSTEDGKINEINSKYYYVKKDVEEVTVEIKASDETSKIKSVQCQETGTLFGASEEDKYTAKLEEEEINDKENKYIIIIEDNAGNKKELPFTIYRDPSSPEMNVGDLLLNDGTDSEVKDGAWVNENVELKNVTVNDSESGVQNVYIKLLKNEEILAEIPEDTLTGYENAATKLEEAGGVYSWDSTGKLETNNQYQIIIWAKDKAGNISVKQKKFSYDVTRPEAKITVSFNGKENQGQDNVLNTFTPFGFNTNVTNEVPTFNLTFSDPKKDGYAASGILSVEESILTNDIAKDINTVAALENASEGNWTSMKDVEEGAPEITKAIKPNWKEDGTDDNKYAAFYKVTDRAGNVIYCTSDGILFDTTPPEGTITVSKAENATGNFEGEKTWSTSDKNTDILFAQKFTVKISAKDVGSNEEAISGNVKIQYFTSSEEIEEAELENKAESLGLETYTEGSEIILDKDEKYIVYAKITDEAGNITWLRSGSLFVDSTKGALEIDYEENGKWTNDEDATIHITAKDETAGDNEEAVAVGLKEVKVVRIFDEETEETVLDSYLDEKNEVSKEPYDKSFSLKELPEGHYTILVRVVDKAGNKWENSVKVKKDITAPTGQIRIDENNAWEDLLKTITFGLFYQKQVEVDITSDDNPLTGVNQTSGDVKIAYYKTTDRITEADELKKLEEEKWISYSEGSLKVDPDEAFIIYARLTDGAGNVTYLSSNGLVVDSSAPTITTEYRDNNTWTNNEDKENIVFTITDTPAGIKNYTVEKVTKDGDEEIAVPLDVSKYSVQSSQNEIIKEVISQYKITIPLEGLEDGDYIIRVKATDNSDNKSDPSEIHVKKDTNYPTADLKYAKDDWTNEELPIHNVAGDDRSGIKEIKYFIDGKEHKTITYDVEEKLEYNSEDLDDYYIPAEELPEGDYIVEVQVTDWAGNEFKTDVTVKKDKTDPTGTMQAKTDGIFGESEVWTSYKEDPQYELFTKEEITVAFTSKDEEAAENSEIKQIEYFRTEDVLTEEAAEARREELEKAADGQLTVIKGSAAEGTLTITAEEHFIVYMKITDNAGNVTWIRSNGMVLDKTPADLTLTYEKDNIWTNQNLPIGIRTTDAFAGLSSINVYMDEETNRLEKYCRDADDFKEVMTSEETEEIEIAPEDIPEGKHTVYVVVTDKAGNVAATQSVTVCKDFTNVTGKIKIAQNEWSDVVSGIDLKFGYGRFYNLATKVEISAEDLRTAPQNGEVNETSGETEMTISYFTVTEEEARELAGLYNPEDAAKFAEATEGKWEETYVKGSTETISITFEIDPTQEYVVYARLTDKAGNVTYLSSDGIVVDGTRPTVVSKSYLTEDGTNLDNVWSYKDGTITFVVNDDLAGIKEYHVYKDEGEKAPVELTNHGYVSESEEMERDRNAKTISIPASELAEGNYRIRIGIMDKAGNYYEDYVTVKRDQKIPNGKIVAATGRDDKYSFDSSTWENRYDDVTFGLFAKNQITVDLSSDDNNLTTAENSGIEKIEYFRTSDDLSETEAEERRAALEQEESKELVVVTGKNAGDSVVISSEENFIVYVKITDQAGNYRWIRSNGMVLDKTRADLTLTYEKDNIWTNQNLTIGVQTSDAFAGLSEIRTYMTYAGNVTELPQYSKSAGDYSKVMTPEEAQSITVAASDLPEGDYTISVEVTDKAGNTVTKSVTVKKDRTRITGSIKIGNLGTWNRFLGGITYGLFTNQTQSISITLDDTAKDQVNTTSRIQTIEYLRTSEIYANSDEAGAANGWRIFANNVNTTTYTNVLFEVTPRSNVNENLIVYLRITDYAGNVTYINSNGVVLDGRKPLGDLDSPRATIQAEPITNGIYKGSVNVTFNVEDPIINQVTSGLRTVTYKIVNKDTGYESDSVTANVLRDVLRRYGASETSATQTMLREAHTYNGTIRVPANQFNSNHVEVVLDAVDSAGNVMNTVTLPLRIDITAPVINVSYDNNDVGGYGTFFNRARTTTIAVTERNFDPSAYTLIITKDKVRSEINGSALNWTERNNARIENGDGTTYTTTYRFADDADYTVDMKLKDAADNECTSITYTGAATQAFTVDNTNPTIKTDAAASITQQANVVTVTLTEHNFKDSDVMIQATRELNGIIQYRNQKMTPVWSNNGDIHTAVLTFAEDGDYTFTISYTDQAGRAAENYTSPEFTVDNINPVLTHNINANNNNVANKGDIDFEFVYTDVNSGNESGMISTRLTTLSGTVVNWTPEITPTTVNEIAGYNIRFTDDADSSNHLDDGIYVIHVAVTDRAGRETSETVRFSVNRNGSAYDYEQNSYLADLVNRQYIQSVDDNLVIVVTNCDEITGHQVVIFNSLNEQIVLTEGTDYLWELKSDGDDGWKEYACTIFNSVFAQNGTYRIQVLTKDDADDSLFGDNATLISNEDAVTGKTISFTVDNVKPEVILSGVKDGESYDVDTEVRIDYSDVNAIQSIVIERRNDDGEVIGEVTTYTQEQIAELGGNSGRVTIMATEYNGFQTVRVRVTDVANNEMIQEVRILVSSNPFIQFINNTPLLIGTIIGVLLVIGIIIFILIKRRKKVAEVPAV